MAFDQYVGTANLRTAYYDKTVKGFAERAYKFKQAVTISSTSAWKNYFFRESASALTGHADNAVKGIPRGADFPEAVAIWERVQSVIEKYGLSSYVFWEDIISDDVDVRERTMYKIAEAVAKSVDDVIWDTLTESRVPTNINSLAVAGSGMAGRFWDVSSAAIIDDLLQAKQKIGKYNYDTSNLMLFVSPKDYRSILNYLAEKGAQFPDMGSQVARNGQQGTIAGMQIVVSNSVTASWALVVVPKVCGTWKSLYPLSTDAVEEKFKGVKLTAVELGVAQLTDPRACCAIYATQKP